MPAPRDGCGRGADRNPAIIEWLEETHPTPPLLPAEPLARARCRASALAIACDIHPVQNLKVLQRPKRLALAMSRPPPGRGRRSRKGWTPADALIARTPGPFCFGASRHPGRCVPRCRSWRTPAALARRCVGRGCWPPKAAALALPAFQAAAAGNASRTRVISGPGGGDADGALGTAAGAGRPLCRRQSLGGLAGRYSALLDVVAWRRGWGVSDAPIHPPPAARGKVSYARGAVGASAVLRAAPRRRRGTLRLVPVPAGCGDDRPPRGRSCPHAVHPAAGGLVGRGARRPFGLRRMALPPPRRLSPAGLSTALAGVCPLLPGRCWGRPCRGRAARTAPPARAERTSLLRPAAARRFAGGAIGPGGKGGHGRHPWAGGVTLGPGATARRAYRNIFSTLPARPQRRCYIRPALSTAGRSRPSR